MTPYQSGWLILLLLCILVVFLYRVLYEKKKDMWESLVEVFWGLVGAGSLWGLFMLYNHWPKGK